MGVWSISTFSNEGYKNLIIQTLHEQWYLISEDDESCIFDLKFLVTHKHTYIQPHIYTHSLFKI